MKKYRDHYFKRAKEDNYPARSVYKLQEINKRFNILQKGQRVLDLGAAPGSWTLFAAKKVGDAGKLLAVDIQDWTTLPGKPVKFPANVMLMQEDVFARTERLIHELGQMAPFHVVMSDMAPKTTGVKFADQAKSLELALQALYLAQEYLINNGHFVVKVFMGPDLNELVEAMRPLFHGVKTFKPKSSRAESKETFYIGQRFKGAPDKAPDAALDQDLSE